ncbi:SCO-spondin-like isoform X2 [Haliotis cracherodii]|uniref:SCO-spondin-like isoform X2 n=1 Tax=Haliotis cracherodii TaxID=6455 RepID=UPI0039EA41F2
MLCSRREWLLVGVLLVAFRQTVSQDIQQLVDNPTINAGSDVSLQVTAATADLAAGTWYLLASPSPVRQLPNNDRTRYSVSGLFHRLTISNVVASDEGRYYYVHGQGVVTQGAVTVATQAAVSIIGTMGDVTALEGSNSSMTTTVSTEGVTNGVWKQGTTVLTNAAGYTITTSGFTQTLDIQNVQTTQAGTYIYTVGGASTQATLTVVGRLGNVTGSVGIDVSFTLNVFPGNAGGSWSRNNVQIADSSKYQITQSSNGQSRRLLVRNAQTADAGAYVYSVNGQQSSGFLTVGAAFSPWTAWTNTSCAVTCGTAVTRLTSRTRTCLAGSGQCDGETFESRLINCQLNQCPTAFSTWTAWTNTSCAVTCGTAITRFTSRTRTCLAGSGQCDGATFESRLINCQLNQCPIDGGFSMWGVWQTSACPVTCGTSATKLRTRSRFCSNPAPQFGGRNCTGPFAETQQVNCNLTACQSVAMLESNPQTYIGATISLQVSVPGPPAQALGAWYRQSEGVFNVVTATARTVLSVDGNIHQLTLINVTAEDAGTYFYIAAGTNTQGDLTIMSPVHGGISQWGPWNNPPCPVTCGQGIRSLSRNRTCTEPVPQFGGRTCSETKEDTIRITCSLANCPIDGGYSPWSQWSNPPCSGSCGNLSKVVSRVRTCSSPSPQFGGRQCVGSRTQTATRSCNLAACTGCPEATIYFVVDQSQSVGTENFQLVKAALNSFVSSIISRNNNIRVGVIGFSSNVTSFIRDTSDISLLQAAINFTLTPPNGGTNTHLGIRRATQNLNQGTSNYPRVMVVITDGLSNLPNETRVAAAEARNSGITVFAVGVLALNIPSIRQRFQAELLSIASSNATAIEIANFNVLTNSLNNISQILCRGTVNGNWASWGPWSDTRCSGTCGTSIFGTANRTRTCTNPAPSLNGNSCVGNSMEVIRRNCGFNPCPINGSWSVWTQWSTPQCTALCGSGVMATVIRRRTCTNPSPSFGGNSCQGNFQETELKTCGLSPCDGEVNGGFGQWNAWTVSPCSATCGRNVTRMLSRQRLCNNPAPANGGRDCIGPRNDTSNQLCSVPECQGCPEATIYFVVDQSESVRTADFQLVKAALNSFVSSIISRNNNIRVGVIGFSSNVTSFIRDTSDISSLQAAINFTLTPPNGGTSTHLGIRRATQYLNQGTSNYPRVMVVITDGLSNLPNETRVAAAEARNSGITVFAVGVLALNFPSIRQRFQAELLSIASSNTTAIEIANFNVLTNSLNNISQILCRGTVNGNWASWGPWSDTRCSGTCGLSIMGTSNRTRTCTDPAPSLNGNSCVGNNMEVIRRNCGFNPCPINGSWSVWTQWSTPQCTALCGSGVMATVIRRRTCTNPSPSFGGNSCQGNFQETELKTCGLSPCDGEVNGGFGQWNSWTVSPCSATCGRNVTRMLSRQRLCNNPAPANGGRDCIGPRNDTSNQLCSVPECQVTALCDDVKKQYGVGYRYHPTDCDKYIQCYDNPRGIAIGVYRSCPFGYYWNQDTFRCTESWKVDCPLERCKGSCGASYKMAGSCRSYWKCDDGKSVARCCPRGFSFSPGDGCYFNLYCDDECPSLYVSRDVCDKHPNWGNTNSYNISLGDLGWRSMSCPANSFFNILDCGCTQVSPATCAASYDFVAGTRPSWVQLEQVNNRVGALSLTNKSKVHLDIKMTVADSPIVFTFTYRETVVSNKSRVLASSKDRLVVSTEPKGVLFTITSWYGDVTRMILSTDGMPLNEWKTVSVMYTCKYLVGTVSNNNVKYMDRVLVKDTNILSDGLTIGSDASRVPGMPFVGDVGRVSVYKCDPGILV